MAKAPKRKNPEPTENTVRSMTTWQTDSGEQVTTIAVKSADGFMAYLAHDPDVRATAPTAKAAETAAVNLYERRGRPNPAALSQQDLDDIEDEQAVEEFLKREAAGKVKWLDFDPKRYGAR